MNLRYLRVSEVFFLSLGQAEQGYTREERKEEERGCKEEKDEENDKEKREVQSGEGDGDEEGEQKKSSKGGRWRKSRA